MVILAKFIQYLNGKMGPHEGPNDASHPGDVPTCFTEVKDYKILTQDSGT